jgi:alkylhydroperoxidase family enzyme
MSEQQQVIEPSMALALQPVMVGALEPESREIAILRNGHLGNSEYEVVHHERAAAVIGMSADRIKATKPGSTLGVFSTEEQYVTAFVDEVVTEGSASVASLSAMQASLSEAE